MCGGLSRGCVDGLSSTNGHIVVKVASGGSHFCVFVLDAADKAMRITYEWEWLSRTGCDVIGRMVSRMIVA